MKISCRWIKKFVDVQADPKWFEDELTMAGLEVEAWEKIKTGDGSEDLVFEIGLTPNRADCLSIYGIAREISALTGNPLNLPPFALEEKGAKIETLASVTLEEPEMCPRYLARVISDVKVGPSPAWLVEFLESVGQRSINNVVDVTNYVMLELGQPLHAFDYDLLEENRIVVRKARQGEIFKTIEGTECRLHEDVSVIADGEKAVALSGIMGGVNSEVSDKTGKILLECAYFDPALIRKTSKAYNIHSESSHRFERGVDPNNLERVIDYAAFLIAQVSGGLVARGRIDVYPTPIQKVEIPLRISRVNKILGNKLNVKTATDYLKRLSFEVSETDNDACQVTVPTYRPDITREIDLIEEIARLNGYNKIKSELPKCGIVEAEQPPLSQLNRKVKNILAGFGFQEIITYSFINRGYLDGLQVEDNDRLKNCIPVINPISQEMDVLRTTLIPGMLETMAKNINSGISDLALFETGKVFQSGDADASHLESLHLIGAVTENKEVDFWDPKNSVRDLFSIKGTLRALGERLNVKSVDMEPKNYPWFAPGKSVQVHSGSQRIGSMGEIHPRVTEVFKIGQRVFLFEISLESLYENIISETTLRQIPRFPTILRDISLVVKKTHKAGDLGSLIRETGGEILEDVFIFDKFEGGNIPQDSKSLSYSMVFRSDARTLTDEEVDGIQENILRDLGKKFGAKLR